MNTNYHELDEDSIHTGIHKGSRRMLRGAYRHFMIKMSVLLVCVH